MSRSLSRRSFVPLFSCRSFRAGLTFTRAPIHKDYPQNIRMKKCPNQKTRSAECFGVSNMTFPGIACLPNTKCPPKPTKSPPIPTKCSTKHEMPTNTYEMLSKTRKAHQYPRNARPNTKSPPIPTKCSAKREMPSPKTTKRLHLHNAPSLTTS